MNKTLFRAERAEQRKNTEKCNITSPQLYDPDI